MMLRQIFDPNQAFIFANAMELIFSSAAAAVLFFNAVGRVNGWRDLYQRLRKMLSRDFQGGPYDLAVAMMVIFIGKAMRTHTAWEWRFFDAPLSVSRLFLGVLISAVGTLCLIRILAPARWFNETWITVAAVALLFAGYTALS